MNEIRTLRKKIGWSIKEAAKLSGLDGEAWKNIERGRKDPGVYLEWIKAEADMAEDIQAGRVQALKDFREANNISQHDAALFVGVAQSVWWSWEHNKKIIPEDVIKKIKPYGQIAILPKKDLGPQHKPLTSAHLKKFREHFGISQAQAADLVKISRGMWNAYERNRYPIPGHLTPKIHDAIRELKNNS